MYIIQAYHLSNRFIKQYGPSGCPARARDNLVEKEDLDDEEEELGGDGEEEAADAPNDPMNDEQTANFKTKNLIN